MRNLILAGAIALAIVSPTALSAQANQQDFSGTVSATTTEVAGEPGMIYFEMAIPRTTRSRDAAGQFDTVGIYCHAETRGRCRVALGQVVKVSSRVESVSPSAQSCFEAASGCVAQVCGILDGAMSRASDVLEPAEDFSDSTCTECKAKLTECQPPREYRFIAEKVSVKRRQRLRGFIFRR